MAARPISHCRGVHHIDSEDRDVAELTAAARAEMLPATLYPMQLLMVHQTKTPAYRDGPSTGYQDAAATARSSKERYIAKDHMHQSRSQPWV